MKSIKQHLTFWLLGGLALLWSAAGAGVYFSVRQSLYKSLDAALAVDSRLARFTARGEAPLEDGTQRGRGQRLQDQLIDYQDPQGSSFFQVWNGQGESIERSESLGDLDLPRPETAGAAAIFSPGRLSDGRPVRLMSFRVSHSIGKGKGRPGAASNTIVLAKETTAIEQTLASLLGGIGVAGLLAAGGTFFLVGIALRHGLRPLRVLGEQSRTIDAPSLSARFDSGDAPAELQPIYHALNELLHRLEQGFERERRFSADLAHEMRTPVAELKMLGEVAAKWPDQPNAALPAHTLAIASQLENLIGALLTLARLESGETALQISKVDVGALCDECLQSHAAIIEEKRLDIRLHSPAGLSMDTDARLLRIILSNLLSNAVEYSPPSGGITIELDPDRITIANTAPGLSQSDVSRLFDRFWRAEESRGDAHHSGLGLALARQAANTLGCQLAVSLSRDVLTFTLKKV